MNLKIIYTLLISLIFISCKDKIKESLSDKIKSEISAKIKNQRLEVTFSEFKFDHKGFKKLDGGHNEAFVADFHFKLKIRNNSDDIITGFRIKEIPGKDLNVEYSYKDKKSSYSLARYFHEDKVKITPTVEEWRPNEVITVEGNFPSILYKYYLKDYYNVQNCYLGFRCTTAIPLDQIGDYKEQEISFNLTELYKDYYNEHIKPEIGF